MIYLDHNATTPLAPSVIDTMTEALAIFGNPSSAYELGRGSRSTVSRARDSVAALIGAEHADEIVFTSGGTEADNWAILGALGSAGNEHVVTTAVEHDAVRKLCVSLEKKGTRVTWIGVDENGTLDLDALRTAISLDTAVVSVMLANNETGILFPVGEVAAIVRSGSNALFHVDAVNAAGKIPINVVESGIDLLSLSAHKFYGPKGVGALYIRRGVELAPMLIGGSQELGRRPGTEAVHQIAGLGAAAELAADLSHSTEIARLRDTLEKGILNSIPRSKLNGTSDSSKRLPNTSNISFENTNGEMILHRLDESGIAVSTGSACHAGDNSVSHVLAAMNVSYSWAMGSIRFSLGRDTTLDEIDRVLAALPKIVSELRQFAPA